MDRVYSCANRENIMLMRNFLRLATGLAIISTAVLEQGQTQAREQQVPSSVEAEHQELHAQLAKVTQSGGKTAAAAKEIEKLLQPHFVKEEQFALPPLAVLADLANGKMPAATEEVIRMSERLKRELPTMLAEHKEIVGALQRLQAAAQQEHKPDAVAFAEKLKAHAVQEEEILYPAAILVGDYLKAKQR